MRPIEDIERDAEAATEGPWEACGTSVVDSGNTGIFEWQLWNRDGTLPQLRKDAVFIAHARQDVPDLTARVRELEGAIEDYCADLCSITEFCTPEWPTNCPLYPYRREA